MRFTRADLESALNELGQKTHDGGYVIDIAVYGGSALILASNFREATADVDAVAMDSKQQIVDRIAAGIAAERGWPSDWLNDGVRTFLSPNVDGIDDHHNLYRTYPSEANPGLRVFVPTPEYLLAMKLGSLRVTELTGAKDREDLKSLMTLCDIKTPTAAMAFGAKFYPEFEPATRFYPGHLAKLTEFLKSDLTPKIAPVYSVSQPPPSDPASPAVPAAPAEKPQAIPAGTAPKLTKTDRNAQTIKDPATPEDAPKVVKLDDVMIAMDVVDTMRHREDLVRRELNDVGREAELIQRLKEIYRQQGIEVPDSVLAEGVKALKDARFTYTPPPAGLKRSLLTLWAVREKYQKIASVGLMMLLGSCGYQYATVTRPAQILEAQTKIELTETLPKSIRQAHADVLAAANDPQAKSRADQLLADGERAIRDRKREGMTAASQSLTDLRDEVVREYTLTIVSRPGETSGVWRRPPKAPQSRNYYLIVEAIAPDGKKLRLPVRNEETGTTETVDKFGVRVPQATFDAVAADKRDDGIVQKNRFGAKKRGTLTATYEMPFDGGMITHW
jgi:hypothetical protein